MKTIKRIIISLLVASILIGGVFTPLMVWAETMTFPSETNSFAKTVYVEAIDKDKPFVDEILPQIKANIAENNKHTVTKYYDALPVLDNPENFQGLGHTTYANINGKTVTAEAFYRHHNESSNDPNNGLGLLVYQCLEYKHAHPEEDVKITFSSYRTSVVASVCVIPESKYYGYMRSLYGTNYDEQGFVRISFMLAEAARMGIEVTLVNQLTTYAVAQYNPAKNKTQARTSLDYRTYYKNALKTDCYNKYAKGKKVSDYMNFVAVDWTISDKNYDMQHVKSATVSNYIATDGTEHGPTVFVSSANLDDNSYKGANGQNGAQAGCIISDHDELYRVTYNYMQLMAKYKAQEDIYKLRKYVNETSQKQIQLIKNGREDEIPKDEQIVYLGSESDKVFEMYFTPFGGTTDSWDIINNPFCKYISKFAKSTDYIELYWNEYSFGTNYVCRVTNKLIENAFCNKPNPKNKFSISMSRFDTSKIERLKIGREIGACNIKDNTGIHSKDIYMSYEEKGVRHKVSLITSCNYVKAGMNYRTNSVIVINETEETGGNYYDIMSEKYTYGMVNNNLMIDPKYLSLKVGEVFAPNIKYSGDKQLLWSIDNPNIASINNGTITALAKGSAIITVTDGNYTDTLTLKVDNCLDCLYANDLNFSINEQYILGKKLDEQALTFRAVIKVNKSDLKSVNTIISSDDSYSEGVSVYINQDGNPCIMIRDGTGSSSKSVYTISQNVATGKEVDFAFSYVRSKKYINFYLNGVWKARPSNVTTFGPVEEKYNYVIGGDYYNGNTNYFPGQIKEVTFWSNQKGGDFLLDVYKNGVDYSDTELLAAYNLRLCENCRIKDLSQNNITLERIKLWQDKENVGPVLDYDYSFAVIGDTQKMCESDPDAMESIYDWRVENKESEKIEYVMGLGDITDDSTDEEWTNANSIINKLNGVIPYSLTRGNHDDWDDFNRNLHNGYYETTVDGLMNSGEVDLSNPNQPGVIEKTFEDGSIAYETYEGDEPEGGIVEGDLTNSYRYLSVGNINYLILTLDFGLTEETLLWADSVIEAHPGHRVIITTHAYMYRDGTTISEGDLCPPTYYENHGYENALNGDEMWEKCFSKHKNIVMVLSGHDPWQHIVYRQDKGENGNIVTQMLIDPQYMDRNIGSTAMVAVLYFSNNSDTVTVRYYSVAKDCYGSELSQFTVDLFERKDNGNNEFEDDTDEDDDDLDDENENLGGENDDDKDDVNQDYDDEPDNENETGNSQEPDIIEPENTAYNMLSVEHLTVKPAVVATVKPVTAKKEVKVNAPNKVTTSSTKTTVTLKWSKVSNASGYKVYKYNSKTKKYEYLKSTSKTQLNVSKLKSGTTYKFKVRAYNKDILGNYSSAVSVTTKLSTPKLKTKSSSKGKVTFSWSNVTGETGYQVYYKTSKTGKYKKLSSYKTNVLKGSKTKLKSKKTYYFKVRAYKKLSNKTVYSSWSSTKKITVK